MKKKIKQKLFAILFVSCWFGIYLLTGSFEQQYISAVEYIVYSVVTFIALGVSGAISGMFTTADGGRNNGD